MLKGKQLATKIYISVFAEEAAEYDIGMLVNRKGFVEPSDEIILSEGMIMPVTLNKNDKISEFRLYSRAATQIAVYVNELSGYVEMEVVDNDDKEVTCLQNI